MPQLVIDYATESERLQLEKAVAYVREMRRLGQSAPSGTVLDSCERFALDAGRAFLLDTLEAAIRGRADDPAAQKKCPARGARAAASGR